MTQIALKKYASHAIMITPECLTQVTLPKAKFMAAGTGLSEADRAPTATPIGASHIDRVDVFRYLGLLIDDTGRSSCSLLLLPEHLVLFVKLFLRTLICQLGRNVLSFNHAC